MYYYRLVLLKRYRHSDKNYYKRMEVINEKDFCVRGI